MTIRYAKATAKRFETLLAEHSRYMDRCEADGAYEGNAGLVFRDADLAELQRLESQVIAWNDHSKELQNS